MHGFANLELEESSSASMLAPCISPCVDAWPLGHLTKFDAVALPRLPCEAAFSRTQAIPPGPTSLRPDEQKVHHLQNRAIGFSQQEPHGPFTRMAIRSQGPFTRMAIRPQNVAGERDNIRKQRNSAKANT